MIKFASWNIRGLNALIKQREVRDFIRVKSLSLCCIIESKVLPSNLGDVSGRVFGSWNWVSNGLSCTQGTRLIIAWDPSVLSLIVIAQHLQYVNCEIRIVGVERRDLWRALRKFKAFIDNKAWIAMGDFNTMLFPHDGLGCQYIWIQKPSGDGGILRKLDRILGNLEFIDKFGDASDFFEPRGISDHSPGILTFKGGKRIRNCGFKFDNFLTSHKDFLSSVEGVWIKQKRGSYMKKILLKMQEMKGVCRRLRNSYGCLDKKVTLLKSELDVAQLACDLDPFNDLLKEDVAHLLLAYQQARNDQLEMVKQKAKISWLNEGDGNSKFFFHSMKEKRNRNHIAAIKDSRGMVFEHDEVPKAFITHFSGILGTFDAMVNPSMEDCVFYRSFFNGISAINSTHY
ncbi:uncharacterized protein LOC112504433 [Cynara cardunculus var. scolymus]|uniref:uncharacterized protein LOC112504433 n=1 Tax=Cynara cardunculus var. scolymus TaxID=59895 RepID=UPI000D6316A0|nr:uncharacterized protein LOC112504433 [Cynara cardunculus var. scolymus]